MLHIHPGTARYDFLRSVALVSGGLALMLAATAVFGWHGSPPPIDLTVDPLGALRF